MAKKIPVGVDTSQAEDSFVSLTRQIRLANIELQKFSEAGDEIKVKELRGRINDLEDAFDKAKLKSREFHDVLAEVPGVTGQVGGAIQMLDRGFKTLVINPIVLTITALVGLFASLKESLSRTEEGTKKLNKISESFTKILNGLFAILEPIANIFADLIISLLENDKLMTGLSKTVGVLAGAFTSLYQIIKTVVLFTVDNWSNAISTLSNLFMGFGKLIKDVFTLNWDNLSKDFDNLKSTLAKGFNRAVDNFKTSGKALASAVTDGFVSGMDSAEKSFKDGIGRPLKKAENGAKTAGGKAGKAAADGFLEEFTKTIDDIELTKEAKKFMEKYNNEIADQFEDGFQRRLRYIDISQAKELLALEKKNAALLKLAEKQGKDENELERQLNFKRDDLVEKFQKDNLKKEFEGAKEIYDIRKKDFENNIVILKKQLALRNITKEEYDTQLKESTDELSNSFDQTFGELKQYIGAQIEFVNKFLQEGDFEGAFNEIEIALKGFFGEEEINRVKENIVDITTTTQEQFKKQEQAIRKSIAQRLITEEQGQLALFELKQKYAQSEFELEDIKIEKLNWYNAQRDLLAQQEIERNKIIAQSWIDLGSNIGSTFSDVAKLLEEGSQLQKAFAITSVLVNSAASVGKVILDSQQTLSDYRKAIATGNATAIQGQALIANPATAPIGAGMMAAGKIAAGRATAGLIKTKVTEGLQIGSIIATAAAQVAAITSAKGGGASSGGSGGIGGDTGAGGPSFAGSTQIGPPRITGISQEGQIAGIVASSIAQNNSQSRPLKAYVVGNDVTTQQQLDRRLRSLARM